MNVYKITTAYINAKGEFSSNFDAYTVLAKTGMEAMAKVNIKVFNKKRKAQEVVDEAELICSLDEVKE